MPGILAPWYKRGDWTFRAELEKSPPSIIVTSYRLLDERSGEAWLTAEDRQWIVDRYVPLRPHLIVPGTALDAGARDFELVESGDYEVVSADRCTLDGGPIEAG